jgi:hypothetical protein
MWKGEEMLWIAFTAIFAIWIVAFIAGVGGNLVHLFLVAAVAILAYEFVATHRATP